MSADFLSVDTCLAVVHCHGMAEHTHHILCFDGGVVMASVI
jgi:hypothetical protein